jgi:modulator of FtsH protease
VFLQVPALGLAVAAMVALLSAGLILLETSRIVTGDRHAVSALVGQMVKQGHRHVGRALGGR